MRVPQSITAHVDVGPHTYSAALHRDGCATRVTLARDGAVAGSARWFHGGIVERLSDRDVFPDHALDALTRAVVSSINARCAALDGARWAADAARKALDDARAAGGVCTAEALRPAVGALYEAVRVLDDARHDVSALAHPTSLTP